MSETPKDAKGIFLAALEMPDPADRAAFVERSCAGDAALRQRVDDLLRAYGQPDGPLDKLAAALASTEMVEPIREQVGATIGPYRLMEQIGEGGFGLVFVAEQERPIRRKVALKIIKPGMDTRDVIARFEAERQALALMDHPNIARVLDAGTTASGRPYFVMELVRGIPITKYCDQSQLSPRERLGLFVAVCNAVQHAHQKGIIHRDLKPSNLLVTLHDGQPVVKIIDFGVAKALHQKLTDRTIYTRFAQMIGTPLYMSPEQAEMSGLEIDTRTDVYSLGVLLYELLTGTTPFDRKRLAQAAYDELIRIIRDEEPPKPSTRLSQSTESLSTIAAQRRTDPAKLSKMFRGDLDWITMKALEKDRTRRYGSARELAEDIERFERGDPIIAKPPTLRYLMGKYVRRNRLQIGTAAAILAAVIVGTVFEFYRIDRDRREAIRSRHEAVEARAAAESAREQALLREQEAHQQKERAEAALKDAEQQRKLAEENLRQTRQAVDKYFTLVSESRLIDIPGAEPLRKELLNGALEYYQKYDQKFPNAKSDDAELQAELAAAHFRMSQIQYFTGAGDWLSEAEKGYDIIERLLAAKTPIEKFKSLDAGVTDVAGHSSSGLNSQSAPRALKIFERGARLWEQLVAARPSSIGFRNDLATILNVIGNLKMAMSNAIGDGGTSLLDEGLRAHVKAQDLWQALSTEHPEIPRFRATLALQMTNVAAVMIRKKKYSESLGLLRTARALCLELSKEFPGAPQYRIELYRAYSFLMSVHLETDNIRDAVGAMRNWLAVAEKMVADFPTVPAYKETLRTTCNNLENVLQWKLSSLAARRDDVLLVFDLYAEVVERQRAIQLSRSGEGEARLPSPPSGEDPGSTFPFPTAHLNQQGLGALSNLFRKVKETDRADLVKAFIERAHRGIGHGGKTYRMAEVALRWWSGQRQEAVKTLESYVRDTPDDSQFQLALVRARAATGQDSQRSDGETDKLLDGLFMALTNPANDAESVRKTVQSIRRLDPEGQLSGARWQRLLRHENPSLRRLAVSSLPEGRAPVKVVAAALEQALSDSDPGVRVAAADRLWTIHHDARQVVPVVVACLGDAFADVRLAATKSLAAIGPAAKESLPALFAALSKSGSGADQSREILTAIIRIDADGSLTPSLWREFATKAEARVRKSVLLAIEAAVSAGQVNSDTVTPLLQEQLRDTDGEVRLIAAALLVRAGIDADTLQPIIEKAYAAADAQTRLRVVKALAASAMPAELARQIVTKALGDSDSQVRLAAAMSGWRFTRDPRVAKILIDHVTGPAGQFDWNAFDALQRTRSAESVPALFDWLTRQIKAQGNANDYRTPMVLRTIFRIDRNGKVAIPRWIELAKDGNVLVRATALSELADYDVVRTKSDVVLLFRQSLRDSDVSVRVAAAKCLWTMNHDSAEVVPALLDAVKKLVVEPANPIFDQQTTSAINDVLTALAEIGPPAKEGLPMLKKLVAKRRPELGWLSVQASTVVWAIEPTKETAAFLLAELKKSLESEKKLLEDSSAHQLLMAIGPLAKEAIPPLFECLEQLFSDGSANPYQQRSTASSIAQTLRTLDPTGETTLGRWGSMLSHAQPGLRSLALKEIGEFGELAKDRADQIRIYFKDSDPSVRASAAIALWKVARDSGTAHILVAELRDDFAESGRRFDDDRRNEIIGTLAAIGADAREALPLVIELLRRPQPDLAMSQSLLNAASTIDRDGSVGSSHVAEFLANDSPQLRIAALNWMSQNAPLDDRYLPALERALHDRDPGVSVRAATLHWEATHQTREAVPVLSSALQSKVAAVRAAAARQLDALGVQARDAVPALKKALANSKADDDRLALIHALWAIDHDPAAAGQFYQEFKRVADIASVSPDYNVSNAAANAVAAALEELATMASQSPGIGPSVQKWISEGAPSRYEVRNLLEFLRRTDPSGKAGVAYCRQVLTSDDYVSKRVQVLDAIRNVSWDTSVAVGTLEDVVSGEDRFLAMKAAAILMEIDPKSPKSLPVVLNCLEKGTRQDRVFAAHVLGLIGSRAASAAPKLKSAMDSWDKNLQQTAAWALWKVARDPSGAAILGAHFDEGGRTYQHGDSSENYSEDVAATLREMGPSAREAVPKIMDRLATSPVEAFASDIFASEISKLVARLDPEGKVAIPRGVELLKDRRPSIRRWAVELVARFGPRAAGSIREIRAATKDRSSAVAVAAADALWRINGDRSEVLPLLLNFLKVGNSEIRLVTVDILESMGPTAGEALPQLTTLLDDSSIDVRMAAARALWKIGGKVDPIRATIERLLSSADPDGAIALVGEMGNEAGFAAPLLGLLADRSAGLRRRLKAAGALFKIRGNAEPTKRLVAAQIDHGLTELLPILKVDDSAATFAIPTLIEVVEKRHPSPATIEQIIEILHDRGTKAKAAVPILHSLGKSTKDAKRQQMVVEATARIEHE